jgi:hypothetical protein
VKQVMVGTMHNGERSVAHTDTSRSAQERQVQLMRELSPAARLDLAFALTNGTREMSLAGLQRLHPTDDDRALRVRLAELLYGADSARRLSTALAKGR